MPAAAAWLGLTRVLALILYEYPLNESIRTMLRLEHLFRRLHELIARDAAVDHHFALSTIFEIMDVAARADLKADILKDLDRQKAQLNSYRGNPSISEAALDEVIGQIDHHYQALNHVQGKAGHTLASNEWLTGIRSRINIPGGTCAFDLPAYYTWQQLPSEERRQDLQRWIRCLTPFWDALSLMLQLLRESGAPHKVVAPGGLYQQSLPQNRTYQLLRLKLDPQQRIVPEISGHRLMVAIRLMRQDSEGRLRQVTDALNFELTLCA
jgi:cell division protein ZapD